MSVEKRWTTRNIIIFLLFLSLKKCQNKIQDKNPWQRWNYFLRKSTRWNYPNFSLFSASGRVPLSLSRSFFSASTSGCLQLTFFSYLIHRRRHVGYVLWMSSSPTRHYDACTCVHTHSRERELNLPTPSVARCSQAQPCHCAFASCGYLSHTPTGPHETSERPRDPDYP